MEQEQEQETQAEVEVSLEARRAGSLSTFDKKDLKELKDKFKASIPFSEVLTCTTPDQSTQKTIIVHCK